MRLLKGNGFTFKRYNAHDMLFAVKQAYTTIITEKWEYLMYMVCQKILVGKIS